MSGKAKRVRAIVLTVMAIAATNYAISFASGVPTKPQSPRPEMSGVPTKPQSPRPDMSGVPTKPQSPRPDMSGVPTKPQSPRP